MVVFSLSIASCSSGLTTENSPSGNSGDNPLFVAINRGATQQYFIDLQSAFKAKIEELGGTAKVFDAKEDPALTISLMNDAVSAGAKGIAVSAQNSDLGPALAKIATDAGVAFLATDSTQKDASGAPVPFVGFDGKAMGTSVGNKVVTLLDESGWLKDSSVKVGVLSVEAQSISVCEDRTNASKDILNKSGFPAGNIYQAPYDGSTTAAQSAAGPVITAHPDVTNWVIFSCNDEGVLGAINALNTAGVSPKNVLGVGIGAYEACKAWAANQPSGFKAALFISGLDVGAAAAEALWNNVVKNEPLPAFTSAKSTVVDASTFKTTLDPISIANCGK